MAVNAVIIGLKFIESESYFIARPDEIIHSGRSYTECDINSYFSNEFSIGQGRIFSIHYPCSVNKSLVNLNRFHEPSKVKSTIRPCTAKDW